MKETRKSGTARKAKTTQTSSQTGEGVDAATLLKDDHRKVEQLFQEYEKANVSSQKSALAKQVCQELIVHTKLEEEIFYPACREGGVEDDALDEAQVEHDSAKILIADLMSESPED